MPIVTLGLRSEETNRLENFIRGRNVALKHPFVTIDHGRRVGEAILTNIPSAPGAVVEGNEAVLQALEEIYATAGV